MRTFEILLILSLIVSTVLRPFNRQRKTAQYFMVVGIVFFLAHLLFEHLRWQMAPAYVGLSTLVLFYNRRSLMITITSLVLFCLAAFLMYSFPVIKLPRPTGPYSVGTLIQYWADPSRNEWFTPENPDDIRELVVQIWYPAQPDDKGLSAPYIDHLDIRTKAIGAAGGFPGFLASYLKLTKTNAYLEALPLATVAPFPILLVSHGITGMRALHTTLAENLASHGYVVVVPDHSYDANLTVFPDGRLADYRSDLTAHPDSASVRHRQLNTRVADIVFSIDQLEKIEEGEISHPLTGYLDLDRIGAVGHSFGGATVIEASALDPRIKACVALDGWINPLPDSTLAAGIPQPFLFLGRPNWGRSDYPDNYPRLKKLLKHGRKNQMWITVDDTRHLDFTDVPLFSPHISRLLEVGTADHKTVVALVNQITLEFFNQFLEREISPILTQKQAVPGLTFHQDLSP